MLFHRPTLLALSAALFISSAIALPLDEASVKAKRADDNDNDNDNEISIRYPDGHARHLVYNKYFNGVDCASADTDLESASHECLYSRVCFNLQTNQTCTKGAEFRQKKVFDRSEIDSDIVCAQEVLCQSARESTQTLLEQELEKPDSGVSNKCVGYIATLEKLPKGCVYEAAQRENIRTGIYSPIYHDKGSKSCDDADYIVPRFPRDCLDRFFDFYDKKNPVKAPSKEEFVSDKECQNLAMLTSSYPDCVYQFANELDGGDRRYSDLYNSSFKCNTLSNALNTFPKKCFAELADYYDKKNPPPQN